MVELGEGLKIPWPVMAVRVQVPLRVLILFVRLCKSMIYEAFFIFNWQFTGKN